MQLIRLHMQISTIISDCSKSGPQCSTCVYSDIPNSVWPKFCILNVYMFISVKVGYSFVESLFAICTGTLVFKLTPMTLKVLKMWNSSETPTQSGFFPKVLRLIFCILCIYSKSHSFEISHVQYALVCSYSFGISHDLWSERCFAWPAITLCMCVCVHKANIRRTQHVFAALLLVLLTLGSLSSSAVMPATSPHTTPTDLLVILQKRQRRLHCVWPCDAFFSQARQDEGESALQRTSFGCIGITISASLFISASVVSGS